MENFGTLYRFELKKLGRKKMVWYTFVILLQIVIVMNIGDLVFRSYYDEFGREMSTYEGIVQRRDYDRKLSGRAIDDDFLKEMQKAYGESKVVAYEYEEDKGDTGLATIGSSHISSVAVEDGRSPHEVVEDHKRYRGIHTYVWSVIGPVAAQSVDAAGFYQGRRDLILADCLEKQHLTQAEQSVWKKKEEALTIPFVYTYCEGISRLLWHVNVMNYLWIFLSAICLSGIFAQEYQLRTDQLILSSRYGMLPLYLARICAGITVVLGGTAALYAAETALVLGIYGADGFFAALQLCVWQSSWRISIGGAVLVSFLVSLTAAVLCSMITMFLSEFFKNGIAALSVMAGVTLFTVFLEIPARLRGLSMLFHLLPTKLLREEGFTDNRLYFIFSHGFNGMQIAPFLYLIAAEIFLWAGYRIYRNRKN